MKRLILVTLVALFSLAISTKAQADMIVSVLTPSSANSCETQVILYFQGLAAETTYQVFKSFQDGVSEDCNELNYSNQPAFLVTTDIYGNAQSSEYNYGHGVYVYAIYVYGSQISEAVDTTVFQSNQPVVYCDQQNSYVRVGQFARVPLQNPSRTRIRLSPGVSSPEVRTALAQGSKVLVVEGPVCMDGYTWWRVVYDYGQITQVTGWMAEIDGLTYYLEPVVGEYAQIVYPTLPNYAAATTLPWMTINTLVRNAPNLFDSSVNGRVHVNEVVRVVGVNASGTWIQVVLPSGETGWSCSQLLYTNISVYPVAVTDNSSELCEI